MYILFQEIKQLYKLRNIYLSNQILHSVRIYNVFHTAFSSSKLKRALYRAGVNFKFQLCIQFARHANIRVPFLNEYAGVERISLQYMNLYSRQRMRQNSAQPRVSIPSVQINNLSNIPICNFKHNWELVLHFLLRPHRSKVTCCG